MEHSFKAESQAAQFYYIIKVFTSKVCTFPITSDELFYALCSKTPQVGKCVITTVIHIVALLHIAFIQLNSLHYYFLFYILTFCFGITFPANLKSSATQRYQPQAYVIPLEIIQEPLQNTAICNTRMLIIQYANWDTALIQDRLM